MAKTKKELLEQIKELKAKLEILPTVEIKELHIDEALDIVMFYCHENDMSGLTTASQLRFNLMELCKAAKGNI
jgi:hypothetical protein